MNSDFFSVVSGAFSPAILISCLISYIVGSIPFTYLLARSKGVNLLEVGSGNPGATNLSRNLGKKIGFVGLVLDIAKGVIPLLVTRQYLMGAELPVMGAMLVGASAVVGHCFSPFLSWKGGKGVATTVGVILAFEPWLALLMLAIWGVGLSLIRSVGIASVFAAIVGVGLGLTLYLEPSVFQPILINSGEPEQQRILGLILIFICSLIVLRHRSNIREFRESRKGALQ